MTPLARVCRAAAILAAEARNLHDLQGPCSHPTSCPMWVAITEMEVEIVRAEGLAAEMPALDRHGGFATPLCVNCDAPLTDGAKGGKCPKCQ